MNKNNEHIKKYLDFYCKKNNNIPFAVLIKGEWGSGKTYFIKKYIGREERFINISLYGISSITEIDNKIFEALHPVLSNPKFKLATKAALSMFRMNTAFDLNGGGNNETSVSSEGLSKIDFKTFAKNSEGKILVFDDLERCELPIRKILGYINGFVEFQEQKVILVMNESKFLNKNDNNEYLEIKEKTIGKAFEVIPNHINAIELFIKKNIKNKVLKKYTKDIEEILFRVFNKSEYNNLRLIKLGLIEFDYNFKNFESNFLKKENKELLKYFVYEFFIYYIEFHKGAIPIEFFEEDNFYSALDIISPRNKKEYTFSTEGTVFGKYKDNEYWLNFFELASLKNILLGKKLSVKNIDKINEKIKSNIKVKDDDWVMLYDWLSNFLNNDKKFFRLLEKVNKKWEQKKYNDLFVVMHIFGMQLYFSKEKILKKSIKIIEKESREYIEYLIKENKFPEDINDSDYNSWSSVSHSKYYMEYNSKEFKNFVKYIIKKQKELIPIFMNKKIESVLKPVLEGKSTTQELTELFINYNFNNRKSYFQYIDENYLCKIITKNRISMSVWRDIFNKRWNNTTEEGKMYLKDEIKFIKKLNNIFKDNIKKINKKFSTNTPTSILLKSLSNILSEKEKLVE